MPLARHTMPFSMVTIMTLRQVLGSVALVWLDDLAGSELLVGVGRVKDLLALDNGKSLESVALAELAAPVARDGVSAALDVVVRGTAGWVALDCVGAAGSGGAIVGVDGVAVVASSVGADTLEVLDGPGGTSGHHGLVGSRSWGGDNAAGGGQDGEDGGELHVDCRVVGWFGEVG